MKIMISYQVDTVEEAKEVMAAVENRGKLTTFRVQDEPAEVFCAATSFTPKERAEVPSLDQKSLAARAALDAVAAKSERANINPGTPLITKIGTATKDIIFDDLRHNTQPPQPKYAEHLKLLWSRGEIKFDGKEYYL